MWNSTSHERLKSFFKEREREMVELLGRMVRIQSGSYHKAGVDRVGRLIASTFEKIGASCQVVERKNRGDHLIVRSHGRESFDEQILLVGHMDTVFPEDTSFNWFREEGGRCFGPGVIDMKGGLVAGIFAIRALDHVGFLADAPITFVFNSDEEIGSGGSREL
ncbi:MAG: M20 family metallopeptidase, partial [Desulfobacterales bacterium]|nr:M20 family metallopeptidase [Desulfobacterales bacterium]